MQRRTQQKTDKRRPWLDRLGVSIVMRWAESELQLPSTSLLRAVCGEMASVNVIPSPDFLCSVDEERKPGEGVSAGMGDKVGGTSHSWPGTLAGSAVALHGCLSQPALLNREYSA